MKLQITIDIKKLMNKLNIHKKIQQYLNNKLNTVRNTWFTKVQLLTGNNPCNILQSISVKFGLFGYKIVHTSGLLIAVKPYRIPLLRKQTDFKLNAKNILNLIFKLSNVSIDFERGLLFRTVNTETFCGRPVGFVIDYQKSRIAFIMQHDELTRSFIFGIKVCQGVLKYLEQYLMNLLK